MADHRRDTRANVATSTMTPIEATHQITVTNHRIPFGGDAMVVAMVCSALESARTISQHRRTATTAAPRRTASLPRRRVWPSPTGAKAMERHGRFPLPDGGGSLRTATAGRFPGGDAACSVVTGSALRCRLSEPCAVVRSSRSEH